MNRLVTLDRYKLKAVLAGLKGKGRSINDFEKGYRRGLNDALIAVLDCVAQQAQREADDAYLEART